MVVQGRMGKSLIEVFEKRFELKKEFEIVYKSSRSDFPEFAALKASGAQLLIDFSTIEVSLALSKFCAENSVPVVVCTTGFSEAEFSNLTNDLEDVPWVFAPNCSLGIAAITECLKKMTPMLAEDFELKISEVHHTQKLDAPSGTAKFLKKAMEESGQTGSIEVESKREGDEIGLHTVRFCSDTECIEISHQALSRDLFSMGAYKLGKALLNMPPKGRAYEPFELFS